MDSLELFKIDLRGLKQGVNTFEFQVDDNVFEALDTTDIRKGNLAADVRIDRNESIFKVNASINQIVFFLNIYNNEDFQGDFSEIPYASIRMYEGTATKVKEVFAQYDVATKENCAGMRALIMGKLYRRNGEWKFNAIGDAFADRNIVETIGRVIKNYNK